MTNVYVSMNRFGHALLEALIEGSVPIAKIVTLHPDAAAGVSDYRDFSAIARANAIALAQVKRTLEVKEELRALKPRHMFVFGWSQLLDADMIGIPRCGVLGSHPALLPRNRGRAAIPWHFINAEKLGGITFFYMDQGCDSGPIVAQRRFAIGRADTASDYYERIVKLGRAVMKSLAPRLARGEKLPARPQNHAAATYLAKRSFEDGMIDWNQPAEEIARLVRGLTDPYPGAWTILGDTMIVIDAAAPQRTSRYRGVPGQVVAHSTSGLLVQTGKGLLEVTRMRAGQAPYPPTSVRDGQKLGITIAQLWLKEF